MKVYEKGKEGKSGVENTTSTKTAAIIYYFPAVINND